MNNVRVGEKVVFQFEQEMDINTENLCMKKNITNKEKSERIKEDEMKQGYINAQWNPNYRKELNRRRENAYEGGGEKGVENQHKKGKLTARERLEYLFDRDSFVEINTLMESQSTLFDLDKRKKPGDGVVVGYGTINGRTVYASSQDFTVIGGTLGEIHSQKICHVMDLAYETRKPYVCINDSGGARIEEGIDALNGYSNIFYRNTRSSGIIPQISVILGPCAGGACYSPAITDFIFMAEKTANMFITGPGVVKTVLGEEVSQDELGGTDIQTKKSGVVHFSFENDKACLDGVKKLLSYLPDNCDATPYVKETHIKNNSISLESVVTDDQKKTYDVKEVISYLVDEGSFFEVQKDFAKNIVIGFAHLDGRPTGIVANNPRYLGGSLDLDSSDKAARFIRFCDCYNIPILTLVDVPGFMPGTFQEHNGIIRHGAKLLYAYAEASVPKVTLIMRKAFGGAYIAMNSKGLGADFVYAWPIAQIAVMGAEGAVSIIYKKKIQNMMINSNEMESLISEYENNFLTPYLAAEKGLVDEVILPEETGERIRQAFRILISKRSGNSKVKKHGNIPL